MLRNIEVKIQHKSSKILYHFNDLQYIISFYPIKFSLEKSMVESMVTFSKNTKKAVSHAHEKLLLSLMPS